MTKGEHVSHHNKLNPVKRDEYTGRFEAGKVKGNKMFRKHPLDAGNDLIADEEVIVPARSSSMIKTGTFINLPSSHVGLLWSRSGLSVKNKIEVGAGCIDENYRGEIIVHLYNHGDEDFKVEKGSRIAQLLVIPINLTTFEEVTELTTTERNEKGFGSTNG